VYGWGRQILKKFEKTKEAASGDVNTLRKAQKANGFELSIWRELYQTQVLQSWMVVFRTIMRRDLSR